MYCAYVVGQFSYDMPVITSVFGKVPFAKTESDLTRTGEQSNYQALILMLNLTII